MYNSKVKIQKIKTIHSDFELSYFISTFLIFNFYFLILVSMFSNVNKFFY